MVPIRPPTWWKPSWKVRPLLRRSARPLNLSGDQEGCTIDDGVVTTPKGFKEAYAEYVAGGWQGLSHPKQYGGQEMPMSLNLIRVGNDGHGQLVVHHVPQPEPGLHEHHHAVRLGGAKTCTCHDWSAAVDRALHVTEPQCGTDLGQVRDQRLSRKTDGSYKITGTKIFISAGERWTWPTTLCTSCWRLPDSPKGHPRHFAVHRAQVRVSRDGSLGALHQYGQSRCAGA